MNWFSAITFLLLTISVLITCFVLPYKVWRWTYFNLFVCFVLLGLNIYVLVEGK